MYNSTAKSQTLTYLFDTKYICFFYEDMLDADVQLLLANAMFFKGAWSSPFKLEKTRNRPFKLDGGKEISIPTMHRVMMLTTGEMPAIGFKWAEFPFQVRRDSRQMIINRNCDF